MNDPSNWNVLIVDDEPDNIGVLKLVLDFHNATVRTAGSGQECLAKLEEELPTFLIVDIQMPEMSGFELFEIIHEKEEWPAFPVIAVTAHTMSGDAEQILEAGFTGYIAKPVDVMTLIEDLRAILESSDNDRVD